MGRKKSNKKRPDGRIMSQIYLGVVDGKRKYKTVYGSTQAEVDRKVFDIKLQLKKGIDVIAQRRTFDFWGQSWLKSKKDVVSNGRYVSLASKLSYFEPVFNMPLIEITTFDLQECLNAHCDLAFATLKEARQVVSNVFELAIANRVTEYNPAEYLTLPVKSSQVTVRRTLTEIEQRMIIETPHRAQRIAMILLFAGLRRGELIPLTWNDISFQNKTITVNKAVEIVNNHPIIKGITKTKAGMRCIDIPDILVEFLKLEYQKDKNISDKFSIDSLVCPTAHGKLMTASAWRSVWNSYMLELDLKYGKNKKDNISKYAPKPHFCSIDTFSAHNLRHTYASILYKAGVDILTAKEQLGHADVKTTLNIYTHLDKQFKRKSMNKLDDYLKKD